MHSTSRQPISRWLRRTAAATFASFLTGMGTAPGTESNNYPNFTKDLFAAEASPYYAAFVEDTLPSKHRVDDHCRIALGHLRRQDRAPQPVGVFRPDGEQHGGRRHYTGAEVYVSRDDRSPFSTNMKDLGTAAWDCVAAGQSAGRSRLEADSITVRARTWSVEQALDSDGYSRSTNWDATCLQCRWQHGVERHLGLQRGSARKSGAEFYG